MKKISLVLTVVALGLCFISGPGAFARRNRATSAASIIEGTGPLTEPTMALGLADSPPGRNSFHSKAPTSGFNGKMSSSEPASGPFERAYVANTCDNTVTVIDTGTNTVVATIPVDPKPVGVAITPDGTRAYVTSAGGTSVSVIATATNTVVATIPVDAAYADPNYGAGVAITPDGNRAYVANMESGKVSVINTAANTVIATIPTDSSPGDVAISPDGTRAYVTNHGGPTMVSVIDTATNTVVATIPSRSDSFGVAFTPDGTRAYVTNDDVPNDTVSVIDTATSTVIATILIAHDTPVGIAITPDGTRAYVMLYDNVNSSVIDTATNTVLTTISFPFSPANPWRVAITPDGTRAYVTNNHADTVFVIDTTTNQVVTTIPVGSCADGFSIVGDIAITLAPTQPCTLDCPANVTVGNDVGECGAIVNYPRLSIGACGAVSCIPPSGSFFQVGITPVTCSTDAGSSCSFTVTVNDNQTLAISCPANSNQLTDPGQCTAVVSYTPVVSDNCHNSSFVCSPPSGATFPIGTTAVSCTARDPSGNAAGCGFTVTVNNQSPAVSLNSPASGAIYPVGTTVSFAGSFSDNAGDVHTAQWSFASNTQNITQAGAVNESTGAVNTSYTFTSTGVYLVSLTVADQCGHTSTANVISPDSLTAMVVIYDPSGGFVTGGGWIDSRAGAYTPNPILTGRASFGFVSKYERGATVPSGNTEFQFRVANFNFHSSVYEWLVVSGARAQYKGSGTVNGAGNYGFLLTAIDGQISGGGGVDKFRIKIWDRNNGDAIVYDNQLNAPNSADPSTALGGGSIFIQK
jgi:YVTN family beta-propeller protein